MMFAYNYDYTTGLCYLEAHIQCMLYSLLLSGCVCFPILRDEVVTIEENRDESQMNSHMMDECNIGCRMRLNV